MLVLDGGQGHSAEKETGSSKEVTLVAQVTPAVQPGAKDGRQRRKSCSQADKTKLSSQTEASAIILQKNIKSIFTVNIIKTLM